MSKEFNCKGKQLANYFVKRGSKLLRTERSDGSVVFIFEYDDSIDKIISEWEANKKKWLFGSSCFRR